MKIRFQKEDAPELWELPQNSVLSLVGGGGKTTLLHELDRFYQGRGFRVLTGTTTHMLLEPELCKTKEQVLGKLDACGHAAGGLVDPRNPAKMIGFPMDVWRDLASHADLVILEADGARHFPFKVPKSHEPCVPAFSTRICVLFGSGAVGKTIRDAAYNPEGVLRTLKELGYVLEEEPLDTVLTEPMIRCAINASYGRIFAEQLPDVPFSVMKAVVI